jgi:hypothetical protein
MGKTVKLEAVRGERLARRAKRQIVRYMPGFLSLGSAMPVSVIHEPGDREPGDRKLAGGGFIICIWR